MPNLVVRHGSKFTVSSINAVQVISEKGKGELFIVFVPVSATLDACVLAFRITQNVQAEFGLAKVNILLCYVVTRKNVNHILFNLATFYVSKRVIVILR